MKKLVNLVFAVSILVLSGTAAAATQTVTLVVKDMTCAVCPITVKKALNQVAGVTRTEVHFRQKEAIVTFDSTKTNVGALIKATTDAGYPSTVRPK